MTWEKLVDFAELISAIAALFTVGLAFSELLSRSKAKKAEIAMDIYSDFLYVRQQSSYALNSAHTLMNNISNTTRNELTSYAETHMVQPVVFSMLNSITKESISTFNWLSDEGKNNSSAIMNFSGSLTNFLLHVNTFFQAYSRENCLESEKLQNIYDMLESMYQELLPDMDKANDILRNNLKKTHSHSNLYLITLFIIIIILVFIGFIL